MTEQEIKKQEVEEREVSAQDDINTIDANFINEVKKNTVSKDEYNKLKKRYEDVVRNNIENRNVDEEREVVIKKDKKELIEDFKQKGRDLASGNYSNPLEFTEKTLDYRDACLKATGKDVFVQPFDTKIERDFKTGKPSRMLVSEHVPTEKERLAAEEKAETLRNIVDASGGSVSTFMELFNRKYGE